MFQRIRFQWQKTIIQSIVFILIITGGFIIFSLLKDTPHIIKLRENPIILESQPLAAKTFKLNDHYRPLNYIKRERFIDNHDKTISDPVTGLMWQQVSSNTPLDIKNARAYINSLNTSQSKGYNDWRLPTIEELMSLLEAEKQNNQLFIDPIFSNEHTMFWSSDTLAAKTPFGVRINSAWGVDYYFGYVFWGYLDNKYYIRAVR